MAVTLVVEDGNGLLMDGNNRVDDMVQFVIGHLREQGQAQRLFIIVLGVGALAGTISEFFPIVGLQVNWDVENLGPDAVFPEAIHVSGPRQAEAFKINLGGIEVPGYFPGIIGVQGDGRLQVRD